MVRLVGLHRAVSCRLHDLVRSPRIIGVMDILVMLSVPGVVVIVVVVAMLWEVWEC
jgi:hypothetical protein